MALFIDRASVARMGYNSFEHETARLLARRELEEAGLLSQNTLEIEAFEGEAGWMIFAYAGEKPARETYFCFSQADALLDALAFPREGLTVHIFSDSTRFILYLTARENEVFERACAHLSEFGRRFEALPLFLRHLKEQFFVSR